MPTFDGKPKKFGLLEEIFLKSLKIEYQLTDDDKINYFHSPMKGDALQTIKNVNSQTRLSLGEILAVFRRKYVKHQSMAMAKYDLQKQIFNLVN